MEEQQKQLQASYSNIYNGIKRANKAGIFELEESAAMLQSLNNIAQFISGKLEMDMQELKTEEKEFEESSEN